MWNRLVASYLVEVRKNYIHPKMRCRKRNICIYMGENPFGFTVRASHSCCGTPLMLWLPHHPSFVLFDQKLHPLLFSQTCRSESKSMSPPPSLTFFPIPDSFKYSLSPQTWFWLIFCGYDGQWLGASASHWHQLLLFTSWHSPPM